MKRYYKPETQREHDRIYREALENCSVVNEKHRARKQREQRDADIRDGMREMRNASLQGARARLMWTTRNQNRLIRVFAFN